MPPTCAAHDATPTKSTGFESAGCRVLGSAPLAIVPSQHSLRFRGGSATTSHLRRSAQLVLPLTVSLHRVLVRKLPCPFFVVFGFDSSSSTVMATYSGLTHKQTAPLVHILGIVSIVLVIIWTYHYRGGYGLSGGPVFNVHPLLMLAGFIFLSSQAVISYKTVSGDRTYQKAVHMTLQGVALLLGIVGILAAYKFHSDLKIQNFYSLHSWFGIITILLYLFQWILGFVSFWTQSVSSSTRAELLPWHIFLGLGAFVTALTTAELGLLEKLTFLQKGAPFVGLWAREAMLVNSIGISVLLFGMVVVLTAVMPNPRRHEGYSPLE